MSTMTRLVFWVFGDDCDNTIAIDIPLNKDVGDLKDAIKEKDKNTFKHVDADVLNLWKVSVPFDDDFEENVRVLDLNAEQPLSNRRKLDSLFSHKSASANGCLDIVVKVPTANSNLSKADDDLTLFCWVLNVSNDPFPVDIGKSKTVDYLKKMIKKKERTFVGIEADTLVVWKLSPPIPATEIGTKLRDVQNPQQISGCVNLNAVDWLSEHFSSAPPKHLHIIVEAPPTQGLGAKYAGEEEKRDRIPALHKRFNNLIWRILTAGALADSAKS